jgi:crotonobetainyl-CoA:carnitine CoA-transferase CaiB-like acyl-CoA transferase
MKKSEKSRPVPTTLKHDALRGIRVLDFTIVMSGPMCTRVLADAGAEVIKVEAPEGDLRMRAPFRNGMSTYFGAMNCGKDSVVLNLRTAEGIEIAQELAQSADVLVENFRPGVMNRLGLGYDSLAARNPRLIYCSISGFGQDGPGAGVPAYAPVIQAASGYELAQAQYQEVPDKPAACGVYPADVLGGIHAAAAINLALFDRERTGAGQHIDVALMDAMIAMLVAEVQDAHFPGARSQRAYKPMKAEDGYIMVAVATPRNFTSLFSVIGFPDGYPTLKSLEVPNRGWNMEVIDEHVGRWTKTRSVAECETVLMEAGVPCSKYKTVGEALADPQAVHRGILESVGPDGGDFAVVNQPYRLSRANVQARRKVADLGMDTSRVLTNLLGYSPEKLVELQNKDAIPRPRSTAKP